MIRNARRSLELLIARLIESNHHSSVSQNQSVVIMVYFRDLRKSLRFFNVATEFYGWEHKGGSSHLWVFSNILDSLLSSLTFIHVY